MDSTTVEEHLKGIFLKIFTDNPESSFDWEKDQADYENWDSFAHLRIVSEIEENFNIKLDIDDIIYVRSALGFLKIIKEKIKSE